MKEDLDSAAENMAELMEERAHRNKGWFNGEVTISHVLLVAGVGLAFWCTTMVKQSGTEARLKALEEERQEDRKEMKDAIAKLDGTVNDLLRANARIETKLEFFTKTHP